MPVRDAYTPVIKLRCGETDVDLLFVSLDELRLPSPLNVLDDRLLRNLDQGAIRSLNGVRVAEMLLTLVPDVQIFRLALRAVKRWARAKGLYSNVLGLLGGVNCAILVTFVCQRYPNAAASVILARFFRIFDSWEWPNPVLIAPPAVPPVFDTNKNSTKDDDTPLDGGMHNRYVAWNPRINPRDRAHLAPIVTPAHPTMNSSYNIGEPQLRAIRDELKLGVENTRRIDRLANDLFMTSQSIDNEESKINRLKDLWREFFGPSDFFHAHRHYVQIDVIAKDDDSLRRWFAWCESRLRGLVVALDTPGYVKARPHATPIEHKDSSQQRRIRSFFIGLSFEGHVQHIDLTPCVRDFSERVNKWEHLAGDMDLELDHVLSDQLPSWVWEHQRTWYHIAQHDDYTTTNKKSTNPELTNNDDSLSTSNSTNTTSIATDTTQKNTATENGEDRADKAPTPPPPSTRPEKSDRQRTRHREEDESQSSMQHDTPQTARVNRTNRSSANPSSIETIPNANGEQNEQKIGEEISSPLSSPAKKARGPDISDDSQASHDKPIQMSYAQALLKQR
uniref:polynucleotide adenylyltransferase n=2 Tax=Aureoumbra lagunensis TaxID=44058 RepID=A0A7S3JTP7_9STRA